MRRTRLPCCARATSGHVAAPASATTNFRRAIRTVIGPAPSGLNPGQRDDNHVLGLHEPAHTTAVTAGRLLWVLTGRPDRDQGRIYALVIPIATDSGSKIVPKQRVPKKDVVAAFIHAAKSCTFLACLRAVTVSDANCERLVQLKTGRGVPWLTACFVKF